MTSFAIGKYMHITVHSNFDHIVRVSYSRTEVVSHRDEVNHPLVREALRLAGIEREIEITSIADIPARSGLGSSSSFTVGLLNALYGHQGMLRSAQELAEDACKIEIEILGEPIGKQDQFITAYGGVQHIQFNPDGTVFVTPVICSRETKDELMRNLMLFYTGQTRSTGDILAEQRDVTDSGKNFAALRRLRDIAVEMKKIIESGKGLHRVGELLDASWLLKRGLASGVSNRIIDDAYDVARKAGAIGGKILGAGGGGFLLLYCEPQNHERIRKVLSELRQVSFRIAPEGSKIVYVGGGRHGLD